MIKKSIAVALSLVMAFSMAGCGKSDSDSKKKTESTYEKCKSEYYGEVELADYDKFVVYSAEYDMTDEEVDNQIQMSLESYKTYEDTDETEVKEDSVANISYVGTIKVNKEDYAFQGGTAENQDLDIANSGYIDGFAEGLVGAKVGEKVTLNLTFPENYGSTTDADGNEIPLSGEKVKFVVTINSIKKAVYPEFTDDFVKENYKSLYGSSTVEEFREFVVTQNRISNSLNTTAFNDYVELCDVKVNEDNLKKEIESAYGEFESTLEQQSMTLEDYLTTYTGGLTEDEFKKDFDGQYETMFKTYAVVCAITEKEGKVVDKDRYNELFTQFALRNGYTDNDSFAQVYESSYGVKPEESLPIQFAYQDALEILLDNATVNEGERPTEEVTTVSE